MQADGFQPSTFEFATCKHIGVAALTESISSTIASFLPILAPLAARSSARSLAARRRGAIAACACKKGTRSVDRVPLKVSSSCTGHCCQRRRRVPIIPVSSSAQAAGDGILAASVEPSQVKLLKSAIARAVCVPSGIPKSFAGIPLTGHSNPRAISSVQVPSPLSVMDPDMIVLYSMVVPGS